jgi:hypothetical protein
MTTSKKILFVLAAITGAVLTYWFVWINGRREFSMGPDLNKAVGILTRVQLAERHCRAATGRYADLRSLGPGGCGGLDRGISLGEEEGFGIVVDAKTDGFEARINPIDGRRLFSLYADQTGIVRFGTRDRPAGPDGSPLPHP